MGFVRDLGAVLSMGLSVTTKHKEAEKAHEKCNDAYQRRVTAFNDVLLKTAGSIQRLAGEYEAARDVLISSGAMTVDTDGNIDYGWYRPNQRDADIGERHRPEPSTDWDTASIRSSHRSTSNCLDSGGRVRNRGDRDNNQRTVRGSGWSRHSCLDRQSGHVRTSRHDRRTRGIGPDSPAINASPSRNWRQSGRQ